MPSKTWKKILLSIGLILYTLIFIELFFTFLKPVPILPRFIISQPFGIRGNMPNQEYLHKTPDYQVLIRTNSKGIRSNIEIPYEKQTNTKRIILLGDSFGMGYGVNLNDTFLAILEKKLQSAGYTIEVINLSVSGFGTAEELIMFMNEGVKYSPDLTIATWHMTDLDDNIRSGLYKLENDTLIRSGKVYLPAVKEREFLYSVPLFRWVACHSYFYNWVREFAGLNIRKITALFMGGGEVYKDIEELAIKKKNLEKLSIALLKQLEFEAQKNNSKILFLDIPRKLKRGKYISTFPALDAENSLPIATPLPYFNKSEDKLLYWERSHGHFTPEGTRLVAQCLYDFIIEKKLLESKN